MKHKLLLLGFLVIVLFSENIYSNSDLNKILIPKKHKILPLGNSITYDNRSNDSRNVGEKAGYRSPLYNLLKDAGYSFDFTGSEHSGGNFLPVGFDEHGGFPGITDDQLLYLLQTGHLFQPGQGIDRQITAGPYLESFSPDIILLHIGTNENDELEGTSPLEVEQILDLIDIYEIQSGKEIEVLLARIINRVPNQSYVNNFNNNVESMVLDRVNNPLNDAYPDKITMVDMQDGAGFNYSISPDPNGSPGDMHDALHPNDKGYTKMADQWFNALKDILPTPPIIISNPLDQFVFEGDTAKFLVQIESESQLLFQWKRNGSNIPLANDSVLVLNNVEIADDENTYSCVISNSNGTVTSKSAILRVSSLTERVNSNLIANYDFEESEGTTIYNSVNSSGEHDLIVSSPSSIQWIPHGIKILQSTDIATSLSFDSVNDTINSSNQFSIEMWISTSRLNQSGPARIFTISANNSERNVTIAQNLDNLVFRTRTTETDLNGLPDFSSENVLVENNIVQIVFTRNKDGWENFYFNGSLSKSIQKLGDLSNWNSDYKLAIGNEFLVNKPWLGSIYHLAIYNRDLSSKEIEHNYVIGEGGLTSAEEMTIPDVNIFSLSQNYPNPFNPSTTITFTLPEPSEVTIKLFNILGEEVHNIISKNYSTGSYNVNFDGSALSSGMYIYNIVANGKSGNQFIDSKKLILLK